MNGGYRMYCIKCGADLPDNAEFCSVCGARATKAGKPGDKKPRKKKGLSVVDIVAIITGLVVCTAVIFTVLKIMGNKKQEEPTRPDMAQTAEQTPPPVDIVKPTPPPADIKQGPEMRPDDGTDAAEASEPSMPEPPQRPDESDADPFKQPGEPEAQQDRPEFDEQEGKIPEGKFKADECRLEKRDDTYYLYPLDTKSTLFQGANDTGIVFPDGVKIAKGAKVGVAISESAGDGRRAPDFTYDYYDFYEKADELFSQSHWQYTDIGYEKEALSFEVGGNVHPMTPVITVNDQGEITELLDFCFD